MDKIKDEIVKALQKTRDEHKLQDEECGYLATLISAVAYSSKKNRDYFYTEVYKIAIHMEKVNLKERDQIKKKIEIIDNVLNPKKKIEN